MGNRSENQTVPLLHVLGNIEVRPLPTSWVPLDAWLVVKCIDGDGKPAWAVRCTEGLSDEELLGVLTAQAQAVRECVQWRWDSHRDGELSNTDDEEEDDDND